VVCGSEERITKKGITIKSEQEGKRKKGGDGKYGCVEKTHQFGSHVKTPADQSRRGHRKEKLN